MDELRAFPIRFPRDLPHGDFLDTACVAAALEGGIQEDLDDFPRVFQADEPARYDDYVRVVVGARQLGDVRPPAEGGAYALVLVQGHADAIAGAADRDARIDLAALESLVNEHTQAIIINSPNNPSGVVFSADTLKKVGDILGSAAAKYGHPIYIIADEPYRELVYDGVEVPFIPNIYKDTIVCYSWSKSLSLPGERIGYVMVADDVTDAPELIAAVAGAARMLGHVCAPSLIQRAVAECCDIMPDLEAYDVNRNLLYNGLTEIGYECAKPQGAFYLFVKAPGGDAMAFAEKAKKKNLLIVPSDSFGVPGYFRLSYCVSKEMIERSLPAFKEVFND